MGYPSKGQGAGKSKDLQKGSPGAFDKGLKGKASKGSETKGSRDGKSLTPDLKGKGKPFPTPDKGKGKPFPTPDKGKGKPFPTPDKGKGKPFKGKGKPLGKKGEGKEASKDETPKTTTTPDSPKDDQKTEEPGATMPEKPAPKETATSAPLPPTLASGFGGMTEDDRGKLPIQILSEHESKVKAWVKTLDGPAVVKNLKVATAHPYYDQFVSKFHKTNFGAGGRDDLVEFDNWLKKMEISEKRTSPSPLSVATSEPAEPAKAAPKPARGKGKGSAPAEPGSAKASVPRPDVSDDATSTSKVPDDALPKLTPDQQNAYKNYWKKFSNPDLGEVSTSPAMPATTPPEGTGTPLPSPPTSASSSPPAVTPECKKPAGILRRSTSVMSDGTGDVPMTPLVDAMTSIDELPPDERKRQREALRRRMQQGGWDRPLLGLRPGLLQKYQNAVTADEKFALLKAFMLDPVSMAEMTIEASYAEMSKEEDKAKWVELPLCQLRQEFTSEAEQRFLQEKIINVQAGRCHPQDFTGEDTEMRLYWVFREGSGVSKQSREVGTKVTGKGSVPANKAARAAIADTLVGRAAEFSRKGAPSADSGKGSKGKTKTGKAGGKTKSTSTRKAAKELSEDDRKKKEFKAKLEACGKLASNARAAAESLKSSGIPHQEAIIAQLGATYKDLTALVEKISDMIFKAEPFDSYSKLLEAKESVLEACKAAEKRKHEKAAAKAKGAPAPKKPKVKEEWAPAAKPEADAEWPEDWPEEFEEDPDIDGEEYPEDEWDTEGIFPDVMHTTHLALAPDVITSCLLDWSDDSSYFAGGSRDRRLNEMWQSYRSWCESQSYPMGERAQRKLFTSSVLKPDHGQYTEISQKVLNASAARYMLFWISSIAKQFAEWSQADSDMYRAGATAGLAEMEVVMLESARFHTNSQWEKLEQCYLLYRAASSKLGVLSLEKGLTRWRQRPKSHSLEHGVYDFWKANMRYMANYLDEDFVRRSKQLAIKASPKYVSRHVLFRYSIAATLRWTQMLPE
ncbi:unnamed protein product [Cladocopium goreaui]|uniref:Uncharacterized protein n=1 Tax=Cladocopium goreaui TaxID=2562237 RepID=A0A9P1G5Y4_9DINO|nr:unnamed protein product [Cladocopium goreaui]